MSGYWKSLLASSITAFSLIFAAGDVCAQLRTVCIDPGHGGDQPGVVGSNCNEKQMNLNVAQAVLYYLKSTYQFQTSALTRTSDVTMGLSERVMVADNIGADVFVSIHHDELGVRRTFAIISDTLEQATYWPTSQFLADKVAAAVCDLYSTPRGLTCSATCLDKDCTAVKRLTVLYKNRRPATLHEGGGVDVPFAGQLCNPSTGTAVDNEARGIYYGIYSYFNGATSVGTSFTASGGPGVDTLRWEESDPNRLVVYSIWRSDACWGPDEYVANVLSQDPAYTPDNRHYTYIDRTVSYGRPYRYTLDVTGERVNATATPTGLPVASAPGTPSNLAGSGTDRGGGLGTVSLTWTASTGTVSGYHVYRSRYNSMVDCNSPREYLGTAPNAAYQDTTAPTGVSLFYRVRAYNSTIGSGISNEAQITIARVVGVEDSPAAASPTFRLVTANPTSGTAQFRYFVQAAAPFRISVYDVQGREIAMLAYGRGEAASRQVSWNGTDRSGRVVASGIYFFRMVVNGTPFSTKRIAVLR